MKNLVKTLDVASSFLLPKKSHLFLSTESISYPRLGTKACQEFFLSLSQINAFFSYVVNMASHIDYVSEMAEKALTLPNGRRIMLTKDVGKPRPPKIKAIDYLKEKHLQFLLEILIVRLVDNYLNYLASLLFEIFIQRPETLKSSETINLETVLSHESIDSLVRAIAERKIEELGYRSFNDLSKYFIEKFKLKLCRDEDFPKLIEAIAVRNISVHNRCIANKRFILQTGVDASWLGRGVEFGLEYIQNNAFIFANSSKSLDVEARKKLKLKAIRFNVKVNKPM